jgi:hypothetical protein
MDKVIANLKLNLNDNTMYGGDGVHLACTDVAGAGSVCAFLQGTTNKKKDAILGGRAQGSSTGYPRPQMYCLRVHSYRPKA